MQADTKISSSRLNMIGLILRIIAVITIIITILGVGFIIGTNEPPQDFSSIYGVGSVAIITTWLTFCIPYKRE